MENQAGSNDKKVLIVEDEIIVCELLGKFLSECDEIKGVKIFFANSVDQCKELLEKEKPTLMILDLSLNGSADTTGLLILKKYRGLLKIAVFSAYEDYMVECLNGGAIEYVLKPAHRREYLRLIGTYA